MASMTRVDAATTTTYVITDMSGNTVTVVVTQTAVLGYTVTFASSGGLRVDGMAMLSDLMLPLATGVLPQASVPLL